MYIQEKLDGSNFRFTLQDDGLRFGSRNTEGEALQRDQFGSAIEFIEETVERDTLESIRDDLGEVVYYGEAMNPHTISYDWEETPPFLGFDIWSVDNEVFLEVDQAIGIFTSLGLPHAPIVDTVPAEQWDVYDFEVPQSEFYDGLAEGVVFKNHTTGTYGKYVREEFKEKAKEKFGASLKKDLTDTELLLEEYVPPARVRSVAHKLLDEPPEQGKRNYNSLRMEMMRDLPTAVIRDMVEEEGEAIFMEESKTVDLGNFRSLVSSRSAAVLRQMIDQRTRRELQA